MIQPADDRHIEDPGPKRLSCDRCGADGGTYEDAEEARAEMARFGWINQGCIDLCPACQAATS